MRRGRAGVVLSGPAGVGKTRLALECIKRAERAGLATVRATATQSAASLPFGALAGALKGGNGRLAAIDDWPDLFSHSPAGPTSEQLVLLVDDAHLLDDASATLIHRLAANGSTFVLATTRSSEPAPDPVVALWKEGLAQRIELRALPTATVERVLNAALGGPVAAHALMELSRRAQGNILILRELVLGALEDGVLVEDDGVWRLRGSLPLSCRLIELVEMRLSGADLAERALLELVAFGAPLGEAELTALADVDRAEDLERRGLLTSSMNGQRLEVRLSHPIYGEVLRAGVPAVRERAIARALANTVEATGARRRDDVLRIASWRLVGGGGSAEDLFAGAVVARKRYDFALAESLARAAASSGGGFGPALLAAELAGLQGRTLQAEQEMNTLVPQATDDASRARLALARIHNTVTWTAHDPLRLLDEASRTISGPGWLDRLEAERLVFVAVTRGPRAVARGAEPLLERAGGAALAVACIPTALSLGRLGRLEQALELADRGQLTQATTAGSTCWYSWWHDVSRWQALHLAGRMEEAEALASAQYSRAIAERSPEAQAVFALLPAVAASERGRARTAAHRVNEALALAQGLGRPLLVRACYLYSTLALALSGREQEATAALAKLDALGLPPVLDSIEVLLARAWTAVSSSDLSAARRHLRKGVKLGEEIGDLVGEAAALHGLARLGRASEVHSRLVEVAGKVDGRMVVARVAHTRGLLDRDAARLETVSVEFEALGADLLAAEAAADGAVVSRSAGEHRAARRSAHRAAVLAERCEFPATPAFQPVEARAELTGPEHDTALLAARGLSNRQIADLLQLSVRTVENRLQRVYQKLGITRRTHLADSLRISPNGHRAGAR